MLKHKGNMIKTTRLAGLLVAAGLWAAASPNANAVLYGFGQITSNGNQPVATQLTMDVTQSGNTILLTFANSGPIASSIADIYIDAPPPGGGADSPVLFTAIAVQSSSPGVSFAIGATPADLPGGGSITPQFVASATLTADSNNPPVANGVQPGEFVTLALTLNGGVTLADVLNYLNSAEMRVGLHVQGIGTLGGSESFVNTPEPTTLVAGALLLLPLGLSTLRVLRKNRA
jgi:hypothetical protein